MLLLYLCSAWRCIIYCNNWSIISCHQHHLWSLLAGTVLAAAGISVRLRRINTIIILIRQTASCSISALPAEHTEPPQQHILCPIELYEVFISYYIDCCYWWNCLRCTYNIDIWPFPPFPCVRAGLWIRPYVWQEKILIFSLVYWDIMWYNVVTCLG